MMLASSLPARARVISSSCRGRLQQVSCQLSSGASGGVFARTGYLTVAARAASKEQPRTVPHAVSAPGADSKPAEGRETSSAYPFKEVEKKWQAFWDQNKTFRTPDKVIALSEAVSTPPPDSGRCRFAGAAGG